MSRQMKNLPVCILTYIVCTLLISAVMKTPVDFINSIFFLAVFTVVYVITDKIYSSDTKENK